MPSYFGLHNRKLCFYGSQAHTNVRKTMVPKKGKKEYVEMNKLLNIRDLLEKVSPELIKKYEEINLPSGQTLAQINEEYKVLEKGRGSFILKYLVSIIALSIILGFLAPHHCSQLMRVFLVLLFFAYFIFVPVLTKWIAEKRRDKISTRRDILLTFTKSVTKLYPTNATTREINEGSIRYELMCIAVWILNGEMDFDITRMKEERDISQTMHLGNNIQNNQELLRTTLLITEERFGLKYKKAELFADAKEYLKRMK